MQFLWLWEPYTKVNTSLQNIIVWGLVPYQSHLYQPLCSSCIMGLFLEMPLLAQDVLPSQIVFGSFKHFQCAMQSFSFIIHLVVPLLLSDIHRHSATQWVRCRSRAENPRTGTKAQFGLSLAKFHLDSPLFLFDVWGLIGYL